MATVAEVLTELVAQAAAAAGYGDAPVAFEPCQATNDAKHGDYQSNHAFRVGKALKANPREVAEKFRLAMPAHPALAGPPEVAGPGFLNFRLSDAWLAADLASRAADPRLGAPAPGAGRAVVVDFSSPNIAKRMHIGHLRSTIIGDALCRLHTFLGWRVIRDNHIGDWGTQFGKLIVGWHAWRDDEAYARDAIAELQRIYQLFGERADADPALLDRAREETAKLQRGDPENTALWEQFIAASMREFDELYARLGVRFDVTHGESFYRDRLQGLVDELIASGVAIESEGAIVIPFGETDGKGLSNSPMLVRKSDGAALYGTSDLATVLHRRETWSPERVVIVTDTRQQLHFRQVFAAAAKIGVTGMDLRHCWFGILRFPDGTVAATRSAAKDKQFQSVNLVDVLDTARDRARAVVDANSPELSEAERGAIAEAVGVGALKYFDLSQNPQSDITFDWDRSLSLDGNSAPYLMYAHARCRSILRKALAQGSRAGELRLEHPTERELALAVARLPEAVLLAAETSRPNVLADHLYTLAQTFSRFYGACRVLGGDVPAATTASRLSLTEATAHALKTGLDLLGVAAPDRL